MALFECGAGASSYPYTDIEMAVSKADSGNQTITATATAKGLFLAKIYSASTYRSAVGTIAKNGETIYTMTVSSDWVPFDHFELVNVEAGDVVTITVGSRTTSKELYGLLGC